MNDTPPGPQAAINIQAHSQVVQLAVAQPPIMGLQSATLKLTSADGLWFLQVPANIFPPCQPGESPVVTIGITRVAVEPVAPPSIIPPDLLKGH